MKSLITGGAGFIGSHVADSLVAAGHEVVVLDDLSGGFEENLNPATTFVKGSVSDSQTVDELFDRYDFDFVFHLAAYAAEGLSHFIKRFNYENNLIGSVNLIDNSVNHGIKCFVFTSSIAVYGASQTPMREDMQPLPEDSYGIAKLAVERELEICREMFGLNYVVFRPHNVYGERQNIGDRYRNVIGIFMNQIMQNKPMTIFGDGRQTRAFTYVKDIAPVIAGAVDNEGAWNTVYNLGAETPYTVESLAMEVAAAMGVSPDIRNLDARKEVVHAFSDHSKFHEAFGKRSYIPLEDGLRHMADWVKKVGSRESKRFTNVEIEKELPASWK